MKETNLSDIFGSLKRKRTGQNFKDEVRKGWKEKEDVQKTKVGDIFGILKGKIKKPTQIIMNETNKELWLI